MEAGLCLERERIEAINLLCTSLTFCSSLSHSDRDRQTDDSHDRERQMPPCMLYSLYIIYFHRIHSSNLDMYICMFTRMYVLVREMVSVRKAEESACFPVE